jgi:hypothetical protein
MKSPSLKLTNKVALEEIYWKIFGTSTITNNEMPALIVCGYIAQTKGCLINWVKVAEFTAKEKAHKDEVKSEHLANVKK